jgi:hypothetical protein
MARPVRGGWIHRGSRLRRPIKWALEYFELLRVMNQMPTRSAVVDVKVARHSTHILLLHTLLFASSDACHWQWNPTPIHASLPMRFHSRLRSRRTRAACSQFAILSKRIRTLSLSSHSPVVWLASSGLGMSQVVMPSSLSNSFGHGLALSCWCRPFHPSFPSLRCQDRLPFLRCPRIIFPGRPLFIED